MFLVLRFFCLFIVVVLYFKCGDKWFFGWFFFQFILRFKSCVFQWFFFVWGFLKFSVNVVLKINVFRFFVFSKLNFKIFEISIFFKIVLCYKVRDRKNLNFQVRSVFSIFFRFGGMVVFGFFLVSQFVREEEVVRDNKKKRIV